MKKILIAFFAFVGLLLLLALILPNFFKDAIKSSIDQAIEDNVEAEVYFDGENFSISLFRHFPNPTITLSDLEVIGKGVFSADTLISVKSMGITLDLFSIFGTQTRMKSLYFDQPHVVIKVLENGDANYDIIKTYEEEIADSTNEGGASDVSIGIDSWQVYDGRLLYYDDSQLLKTELFGVDHQGSGDFTMDIFDMKTETKVEKAYLTYDGIPWINGQGMDGVMTIHVDLPKMKFSFRDNIVMINDFPLSFEGYVALPGDTTEMDLSFRSENATIKSLYSLIPAVYTEDFKEIEASGVMSFEGKLTGIYDGIRMPDFEFKLLAENGMIRYPALKDPIRNINLNMRASGNAAKSESIEIDIPKMHLELGDNPIDGSVRWYNLDKPDLKVGVNARINLEEMASIVPIEGTALKGLLKLDLEAEGVYDSATNKMPAIKAAFSVADGYLKNESFPKALEQVNMQATVFSETNRMEDVKIEVPRFRMVMDGTPFEVKLSLRNLVDYQWDLAATGKIDLGLISELYPVQDKEYSGTVEADIHSKGKYSDLERERYDLIPTTGTLIVNDLFYADADVPQGLKINSGQAIISPDKMMINGLIGSMGQSDFNLTGQVDNYIDYIFKEDALLKGRMDLNSNTLDMNEWMSGEPTEEKNMDTDTADVQAFVIPENIDFEFNSFIKAIYYDNLKLTNARGNLILRDGILNMSNLTFGLLGGQVTMNGQYNTQIPEKPSFNYKLQVRTLSIPAAYQSFSTVQTFAPMARQMNGDFSSEFSVGGNLTKDLTPEYTSLNGNGIIKITEAFVKESKLVSGIFDLMKIDLSTKELVLKDVVMMTSLEDGRAYVQPFNVRIGKYNGAVSGSIGADGSLDYKVNTDIEAGAMGKQINALIGQLTDSETPKASSSIKLNFGVGGSYDQPKITLLGTTRDGKETTIDEVVKEEATEKITTELMNLLKKPAADSANTETGEKPAEEAGKTADELKNTLQDLFNRKKKNDGNE